MEKEVFEEIENWKLEAKLEDVERYFYHTKAVSKIENGTSCYIIGRKGAGKTAISEYLHKKMGPKKFSKKLTFKNFPFHDLYQYKNSGFHSPNEYITLWKYIIYSSIAQLMAKNANVDEDIRDKLSKIYTDDPVKSLSRTISKWISSDFDLKVLGTGIKLAHSKSHLDNVTPWIERVEILEDIIASYIDDSSIL